MNADKKPEQIWQEPPPGMEIVTEGTVQEGDFFYVAQLGAWAPVPKIGWGEPILNSRIARGKLDLTKVKTI